MLHLVTFMISLSLPLQSDRLTESSKSKKKTINKNKVIFKTIMIVLKHCML